MIVRVDDRAAVLAVRLARAVDAWMGDPRDTRAYERVVAALADWRAYVQPRLDDPEILDALADVAPPAQIGELLAGPPGAVYGRLLAELKRPGDDEPRP